MLFTWFRSGRGDRLGKDPRYTNPAFIVKKFDNIHYSMIEDAEEFYNANSLEKCFFSYRKTNFKVYECRSSKIQKIFSSNRKLLDRDRKYIKKLEKLLDTNRTKSTNNEIKGANLPRKKDVDTFFVKTEHDFRQYV